MLPFIIRLFLVQHLMEILLSHLINLCCKLHILNVGSRLKTSDSLNAKFKSKDQKKIFIENLRIKII